MTDDDAIPSDSPSAQGVDATGVLELIDALEATAGQDPHSLMLVRHGRLVAASWWAPYARHRPHLVYSLSKSFTSAAAGFAVAEGLIDLDARVVDYFDAFADEVTDERSREMRVRHVASMASGHTFDTLEAALDRDTAEPVRGFLLTPPQRDPGTVFAYNQPATYTLAAIIQRQAGCSLTEYLRPRLFEPLGLPSFGWQQHPAGRELGFSGLHTTTDAVARLGLLHLNRGEWQGRRLLPADWVDAATSVQVPTVGRDTVPFPNPDWALGYGFQFWRSRHGYRGDGAFGQFCLVLPEQDAVVAYTGATHDLQGTLDLIWRHLLPAFCDAPLAGPAAAEADARLQARLAGLRVAAPASPGADGGVAEGPAVPERWDGARFAAGLGSTSDQPAPTGVRVTRASGAGGGWRVELQDAAGGTVGGLLGVDDWAITEDAGAPIAIQGGWVGGDVLRFDVIFLETPHRLELTCRLGAGEFEASWQTAPLPDRSMTRLSDLKSPPAAG